MLKSIYKSKEEKQAKNCASSIKLQKFSLDTLQYLFKAAYGVYSGDSNFNMNESHVEYSWHTALKINPCMIKKD